MNARERIDCPDCGGKKKMLGFFPVYAEHVLPEDRAPVIELDCPRCNGHGDVPSAMLQWMNRGQELREERRSLQMGLREFCKSRGIDALVRSNRERGAVDPETTCDVSFDWEAD